MRVLSAPHRHPVRALLHIRVACHLRKVACNPAVSERVFRMTMTRTLRVVPMLVALMLGAGLAFGVSIAHPNAACAQGGDIPCGFGRLEGRVTANDTGEGLGNVFVNYIVAGQDFGGSAMTNADGYFGVNVLAERRPVSITLSASAPSLGYLAGSTAPTTIMSGTLTTVAIELDRGGAITGEARAADSGLPLTETRVIAFEIVGDGEFLQRRSTAVDASGRYTVNALLSGAYVLQFVPEGPSAPYMPVFYGGGQEFETGQPIQVVAPEVVSLPLQTAQVGGAIQGTVRRSDTNAAVSQVFVDVYDAGRDYRLAFRTIANVGGTYLAVGLAPGEYVVRVQPRSADVSQRDLLTRYYGGAFYIEDADTVVVGAENLGDLENRVRDVDVVLPVGGRIRGQVSHAVSGEPLANVDVTATAFTQGGRLLNTVAVRTNADGEYELIGLEAGNIRLVAGGGRLYTSVVYPNVEARWDQTYDELEGVELIPVGLGETVESVDVTLNSTGIVRGRVTDPDGAPIADVSVALHAAGADGSGRAADFGSTNANGEFELYAPAGDYSVYFYRAIICGCYNDEVYQPLGADGPSVVVIQADAVTDGIDAVLECGVRPDDDASPSADRLFLPLKTG